MLVPIDRRYNLFTVFVAFWVCFFPRKALLVYTAYRSVFSLRRLLRQVRPKPPHGGGTGPPHKTAACARSQTQIRRPHANANLIYRRSQGLVEYLGVELGELFDTTGLLPSDLLGDEFDEDDDDASDASTLSGGAGGEGR